MTLYKKVIRFLKCSEKSCKWSKILYHEQEWDPQINLLKKAVVAMVREKKNCFIT